MKKKTVSSTAERGSSTVNANEIDKVALIYLNNRKILSSKTKGRTVWYIPGGKREGTENDHQTLIREIREELNVEVDPNTIVFFGIFNAQADHHPEGVTVKMTCYSAEVRGEITPSSEIESVDFLVYSDCLKCSPVDKIIFQYLFENDLID